MGAFLSESDEESAHGPSLTQPYAVGASTWMEANRHVCASYVAV
jgi:hypothetical protein